MSYFHTGTRTIIGAEAFHCPVRDGKEWDHLAMVIRLNLVLPSASISSAWPPIRRVLIRGSFAVSSVALFSIASSSNLEERFA